MDLYQFELQPKAQPANLIGLFELQLLIYNNGIVTEQEQQMQEQYS